MKGDLHMHSVFSDGGLTIRELGKYADEIGLDYIAITDHDTLDHHGHIEEELKGLRVKAIAGIEISAYDFSRKRRAHILGFGIKDKERLSKITAPMLIKRREASEWMVEKIRKYGYPLTLEHVERKAMLSTTLYKQHIMLAMMELGYGTSIRGPLYKELFGKPTDDFKGGIAYMENEYIDGREAVEAIKSAGGTAILAHPGGYKNVDYIPELKECGLDGIEVWHSSHSKEDEDALLNLSKHYDFVITGGSDFHGLLEGHINPLGSSKIEGIHLEEFLSYIGEK